jgi:hypothetical protein
MGFFNNNIDAFAPGTKITFANLDFVTNKLGDLHLCNPDDPVKYKEESPYPLYLLVVVTNAKILYTWTTNISRHERYNYPICIILS